jgi:hypothetical protein
MISVGGPEGNGHSAPTMARLNTLTDNLFAETRGVLLEIIGVRCIFRDSDAIEQLNALKKPAEILDSKSHRMRDDLKKPPPSSARVPSYAVLEL